MTQPDPFPGLPDAGPDAVAVTARACERIGVHLGILAGRLRETPLGADEVEQVDASITRVITGLAALITAVGEQRP